MALFPDRQKHYKNASVKAGFFAHGKEVFGLNRTVADETCELRLGYPRFGIVSRSFRTGPLRRELRSRKQLQMREQPRGDFRRFLIAPHRQIRRDLSICFIQWLKLALEIAFRNPAILGVD
jgi:hypothetical protein